MLAFSFNLRFTLKMNRHEKKILNEYFSFVNFWLYNFKPNKNKEMKGEKKSNLRTNSRCFSFHSFKHARRDKAIRWKQQIMSYMQKNFISFLPPSIIKLNCNLIYKICFPSLSSSLYFLEYCFREIYLTRMKHNDVMNFLFPETNGV